jgi:2-keto-3-deoxy-L-rhamnonate aldolase RhmA
MIELLQITNDETLARLCDELGGFRLFIDWERNGKAERQAGRNTFISTHTLADLQRIATVVKRTPVMVRVNPLHEGTSSEIQAAIDGGASRLMLPMFRSAAELTTFIRLVDRRLAVSALMEHADALVCMEEWVDLPGLDEVYVGLNDLHLSLGMSFMFEPLANGMVERVLRMAQAHGKRVGFGGIARMNEGELPGRAVLGEHVRLGSQAVILSRTFHRFDVGGDSMSTMREEVALLRQCEHEAQARSSQAVESDRLACAAVIERVADRLKSRKP